MFAWFRRSPAAPARVPSLRGLLLRDGHFALPGSVRPLVRVLQPFRTGLPVHFGCPPSPPAGLSPPGSSARIGPLGFYPSVLPCASLVPRSDPSVQSGGYRLLPQLSLRSRSSSCVPGTGSPPSGGLSPSESCPAFLPRLSLGSGMLPLLPADQSLSGVGFPSSVVLSTWFSVPRSRPLTDSLRQDLLPAAFPPVSLRFWRALDPSSDLGPLAGVLLPLRSVLPAVPSSLHSSLRLSPPGSSAPLSAPRSPGLRFPISGTPFARQTLGRALQPPTVAIHHQSRLPTPAFRWLPTGIRRPPPSLPTGLRSTLSAGLKPCRSPAPRSLQVLPAWSGCRPPRPLVSHRAGSSASILRVSPPMERSLLLLVRSRRLKPSLLALSGRAAFASLQDTLAWSWSSHPSPFGPGPRPGFSARSSGPLAPGAPERTSPAFAIYRPSVFPATTS